MGSSRRKIMTTKLIVGGYYSVVAAVLFCIGLQAFHAASLSAWYLYIISLALICGSIASFLRMVFKVYNWRKAVAQAEVLKQE